MERMQDLIPEVGGFPDDPKIGMEKKDGIVTIRIDGEAVMEVTEGQAKMVFVALLRMYGIKMAKKMDRAMRLRRGVRISCRRSDQ